MKIRKFFYESQWTWGSGLGMNRRVWLRSRIMRKSTGNVKSIPLLYRYLPFGEWQRPVTGVKSWVTPVVSPDLP